MLNSKIKTPQIHIGVWRVKAMINGTNQKNIFFCQDSVSSCSRMQIPELIYFSFASLLDLLRCHVSNFNVLVLLGSDIW
jgi:hypothetical protein